MGLITRSVVLAIVMAIIPDAFAQTASPAPGPTYVDPAPGATKPADAPRQPPAQSGTSAVVLDLAAIDGVIGKSVKSYAGEDMGRIVDLLATPTGQVRAAVIDFGGLLGVGSRKVAVDWKALDFSKAMKGGAVTLNLTRNEVRVSPEYKADDPVVVLEAAKPSTAPIASPGK